MIGLVMVAIGGAPLLHGCFVTHAPLATVESCEVHQGSHGISTLELRLSSGKRLLLSDNGDIDDARRCLALGTMVEKRRGELRYRVDNELQQLWGGWGACVGIVAVGGLFLVGGSIAWLVSVRQRTKRAATPTLAEARVFEDPAAKNDR